ncbi:ABC transporter ATP-binding protein [Paenibacillus amylolyticus]|uniref:ABC transporter ATP-binding protein n=1 Tax=Paenibacillus amylolyticus TaxID=1451 RepID=UPI003EB7C890
MNVIRLENVSKSYKGISLFENVNAIFEKGKIYGITGPNGAGKSVLFKLICKFIKPDSGAVYIHPEFMRKGTDFPQQFGIIIDRPGYIAGLTGYQNLKRWAQIQNRISDQDIYSSMKQVGLDPNLKQKMKNYSLGMKQKIALAQAIMENQQILILDEPFNALDADSVQKIRTLLKLFKEEGRTILLTSHQQEDIDILCDTVFQINQNTLKKIR